MRKEEREKLFEAPRALAEVKQLGEGGEKFIRNMLDKFEGQYNQFLKTPNNVTPAMEVNFSMQISKTPILESDLRLSGSVPEQLYKTALRDEEDPTKIQVMYLRIEKTTSLRENHGLVQRPGAAETLQGNLLSSLLYHAAVLLMQRPIDSALEGDKFLELEEASAKHRLVDDAITHLFCNGIQYQESSNERQWQMEHKMQLSKVKEKADELNQLFEDAANMKVSSN